MKTSAQEATSVRMAGNLSEGGEPMTIDLRGQRDGSNQLAEMTIDGGQVSILTVDGKDFIKGDDAYWASAGAAEVGTEAAGRYVTMSAAGGETMGSQLNPGMILDEIFAQDLNGNVTTKVEEVDRNGEPAYKITDRLGDQDAVLWLSADGKAQLLEVSVVLEGEPMKLTFSEWNEVEKLTAPPADQILSL